MVEKGVAEQFTQIIEHLEHITNFGQRRRSLSREITLEDVMKGRPSGGINTVPVDYFRLVRLVAWQEMSGGNMQRIAYRTGEKIGRRLKVSNLNELSSIVEGMGIARMQSVTSLDDTQEEGRVVIMFTECSVCSGLGFLGEPVCHFESGLLAGSLERIYRKRMVVRETMCLAAGADHCRFESDASGMQHAGRFQDDFTPEAGYSEDNLKLLSTLAAHTVAALENAVRYEHTRKMVVTDPLTRAYNYGYFQSRLKEELQRAERQGQFLAVVMADIDGFKKVNDRFGHPAGDRVIKEAVQVFRQNTRGIDILCRYGGDEFALILPQTDRNEAAKVVERMRAEVERHNFAGAVRNGVDDLRLSASFGCAIYPQDSHYGDQLVEQADHALYSAKRAGKNRLLFHGEIQPARPVPGKGTESVLTK